VAGWDYELAETVLGAPLYGGDPKAILQIAQGLLFWRSCH